MLGTASLSYEHWREKMLTILGYLEAAIDFIEEDGVADLVRLDIAEMAGIIQIAVKGVAMKNASTTIGVGVVNMWCAHTSIPRKAMAAVDAAINLRRGHPYQRFAANPAEAAPHSGVLHRHLLTSSASRRTPRATRWRATCSGTSPRPPVTR